MSERVAVCIVTYNSADDLEGCFQSVAALDHRPLELVVVDCASRDDSVDIARRADVGDFAKRVVPLKQNLGFAGGMNEAIGQTDAPWILALNADARPRPDFVSRLLERADACMDDGMSVAAVTGRLLRFETDGEARLDACGMRLIPAWRHLDRGSGELDRGQYMEPERVFGGTGAATLYRREALDDVAFGDGIFEDRAVFDPLFHSYREDAELCFRFQERDWQVIYEPNAVAEHRRRVVPQNRRQVAAAINRHSLKNRYLLRAYHQTAGNFLRTFLATTLRDIAALAYVSLFERTSLSAYGWLWRHRRQILERRRYLMGRRKNSRAVESWFRVSGLPLAPAVNGPASDQGSSTPSS